MSYRIPQNREYDNTIQFLVQNQFPAVLEKNIELTAVLPKTGRYRHVNPGVRPFKDALLDTTGRVHTLSGIGSLIDYERFGHRLARPNVYAAGGACESTSLCVQPTCFGVTEGVIESNNEMRSLCWSLGTGCLKDQIFGDTEWERKMKARFAMFFAQAPAVLEAYQRTRLIKESIKVVATSTSYTYSGPVIGGPGTPLPFYMDPVDARNFPNLLNIPIGGFNVKAFSDFLSPRLLADAWTEGRNGVTTYGIKSDKVQALEQTATVIDHYVDINILAALRAAGMDTSTQLDELIGTFVEDSLFPTFKVDGAGNVDLIPAEYLEPSTLAGFVQTSNPEHLQSRIRGLLFVPDSWSFDLVEQAPDNFSFLGLGEGLNFAQSTPGVFPVMSSSMFATNKIGPDGVVILGQRVGKDGRIGRGAEGLVPRSVPLKEAVRTDLVLTYSQMSCQGNAALHNVGAAAVPQSQADGFELKSRMNIFTNAKGTSRPVLVLFKIDAPRSAKPIEVCNTTNLTVNPTSVYNTVDSCCPGNQIYAVLTFRNDVGAAFAVGNAAAYRTGPKGATYLVTVTSVSGNTVVVQSQDGTTILPCCTGLKDDYGTMAELIKITGATATSAEIMKARCDTVTSTLYLEFFDALASRALATPATITLEDGSVINVLLSAAASGVTAQVQAAPGETCSLCNLDCASLMNAIFAY